MLGAGERESAWRGYGSRYHFDEADVLWQDVPNPGPGLNATFTVQSQAVIPFFARATLATDANAANRLLTLDYLDGRGNVRVRNGAPVLITANTSAQAFEFDSARTGSEWNTGTPVWVPLHRCIIDLGMAIRFTITSVQVGDALTALSLALIALPTGMAPPSS